jgi:molecular chaperone DnaJ
MVTNSVCPRCGGHGRVISDPCSDCGGEGRQIEERTYTVDIPAGVDTGSTLRLTGRGAAGPRGGGTGDLYVHVRVQPHETFTRDGFDLRCDLPISFTQAALGAHLEFATLDGVEDLVIPRGTPSGREFRLKGRGVPHLERRSRGDLIVRASVQVPDDLTEEQEDLLRQYAAQRGDDVAPADAGFLSRIRSAFR